MTREITTRTRGLWHDSSIKKEAIDLCDHLDMELYGQLLVRYEPKPIGDKKEHERVLSIIERLISNDDRSPEEGAILSLFTTLVEVYEPPMPVSTPSEILKHLLTERGMKKSELAREVGTTKGNISAMVSGKRKIGLKMAKKLTDYFGVSIELFIED